MRGLQTYLFVCLVAGAGSLSAQQSAAESPFDSVYFSRAFGIRESLELFTDRSYYTVNETIRFRADYNLEGLPERKAWSRVLYAELVAPDGTAVARGKFPLYGNAFRGGLNIPEKVPTGNYSIRCYTRWMRNRGPGSFSHVPVTVINPYSPELTSGGNGETDALMVKRRVYEDGPVKCEVTDAAGGNDPDMEISLMLKASSRFERIACCVSVVPMGMADTVCGQITVPGLETNRQNYRVEYLPDLYGLSMSGTVSDQVDRQAAVPYAWLHFVMLGEDPAYLTALTDRHGRFVVPAPERYGSREIFVSPEPSAGDVKILIDRDFETLAAPVPDSPFGLNADQVRMVTDMAVRTQLAEAYGACNPDGGMHPQKKVRKPDLQEETHKPDPQEETHKPDPQKETHKPDPQEETHKPDPQKEKPLPFYGTPANIILLDDYIRLPSLEEVFVNLVPEVHVTTRRREKRLEVEGVQGAALIYPPLILVDLIPLFDHRALMALGPDKIARIEVVDELYVKGSKTFGGIISLFSRKGDMAGIDLPPGSYFFDFPAYSNEKMAASAFSGSGMVEKIPETGDGDAADCDRIPETADCDRIPDLRNTIFWLDEIILQRGVPERISFRAPGREGNYLVLVRGKADPGGAWAVATGFRVERSMRGGDSYLYRPERADEAD